MRIISLAVRRPSFGFGGVVAVLPGWIALDVFDGHVAHHAIAAGDLDGEAGEGHEGVGEAGIGFAPDEALHAAHGGAEDEAEVVDVEAVEEHLVLRADHVVVVVVGELHAQAVGGFGGFALADVGGEDEEVFVDVEGLAGAEEDVGEDGIEEGVGVAAGAVEEKDGVVDVAGGVAVRGAEGEVVELEFGEGFAGAEVEVVGDVVAGRAGVGGRGRGCGGGRGHGLGGGGGGGERWLAMRREDRLQHGRLRGGCGLRALAKCRGLSTSLRFGRDDEF